MNRPTATGSATTLEAFVRHADWISQGGARYVELLEHSPHRHAWQFETNVPPLDLLRSLSRKWPVTFLLDYDCEDQCLKGLVKARNGRVRHFRVRY